MPHLGRTHPRLTIAGLVGFASGVLCSFVVPGVTATTHILIGWNIGVWTYLILMMWLTLRADSEDVKRFAIIEDENAGLVLALVCIAAIASLAAISVELIGSKDLGSGAKALH